MANISRITVLDGTTYDIDAVTVNGHSVDANVPANAVFTDTTYANATTLDAGLMSSSDKSKLDQLTTAGLTDPSVAILFDGDIMTVTITI